MKRLILYVAMLCLLVGFVTGCVAKESITENETESEATAESMSDEYIIERFNEANDFWLSWVYGQRYVTDRITSSQNMYYGAVDEESPIQTKEELKAAFEAYFTEDLAGEFMSFLNPEDIDGKLYIAYGDVGDNGEILDNVAVEKVDDAKYELTLDMTQYFTDEKYTEKVYYVLENNKWVFENDERDRYFFHWQKHRNIEYLPVMKKYYLAMAEEWNAEKIDKHGLVDIISAFYDNEPLECIGYALMDINNDGQNELLIGKVNADDKIVWDMYSVKDGKAYRVLVSGERNRHYICESDEGYIIANEIHTNAMNYSYTYYADLDESILKERLSLVNGEWHYMADYLNVTSYVVDEERVNEIVEKYQAKYITPQFIPFEMLG